MFCSQNIIIIIIILLIINIFIHYIFATKICTEFESLFESQIPYFMLIFIAQNSISILYNILVYESRAYGCNNDRQL